MRGGEVEALSNDEREREDRVREDVTGAVLRVSAEDDRDLLLLVLCDQIDEAAVVEAVVVRVGRAAAENGVGGVGGREELFYASCSDTTTTEELVQCERGAEEPLLNDDVVDVEVRGTQRTFVHLLHRTARHPRCQSLPRLEREALHLLVHVVVVLLQHLDVFANLVHRPLVEPLTRHVVQILLQQLVHRRELISLHSRVRQRLLLLVQRRAVRQLPVPDRRGVRRVCRGDVEGNARCERAAPTPTLFRSSSL